MSLRNTSAPFRGVDGQRHAEAQAEILPRSRGPAEALRRVDDLRKAVAAGAEPRPDLAAGGHVLGHASTTIGTWAFGRGRQRRADQTRASWARAPAGEVHAGFEDLARIDRGVAAVGEPLGEAAAHGGQAATTIRRRTSGRGSGGRAACRALLAFLVACLLRRRRTGTVRALAGTFMFANATVHSIATRLNR